jgi:transcriptional regulator with XRE-family HTH domain
MKKPPDDTMRPTGIGGRLASIRQQTGLTQIPFAKRIGVSQTALVAYEKSERDPPASAIALTCAEFGIAPEWLLMGTGPKTKIDAPTLVEMISRIENRAEGEHRFTEQSKIVKRPGFSGGSFI